MFQNFKADIIYYNTPADFELEFNLCGCCRMRLLNDKCADKKTLLTSLSRAFSRSRVIILTAPLFDGSDIIKTVSVAIGKGIEEAKCDDYGINTDTPIEITKGSTPLVTSDGIFGGCIIESGPQTLIILTDNKPVRKTIMKDLIHPYIEEIATGDTSKAEETEPQDPNEIITEVETQEDTVPLEDELNSMLVTDSDTTEAEITNEEQYPAEELITETIPEEKTDNYYDYYTESNDLYTEITKEKNPPQKQEEAVQEYYEDGYYVEETPEEKSSAFNIALIVISAVLLLAIAVLCFCIFFVPAQSGTTPAIYLKEIFEVMFK